MPDTTGIDQVPVREADPRLLAFETEQLVRNLQAVRRLENPVRQRADAIDELAELIWQLRLTPLLAIIFEEVD